MNCPKCGNEINENQKFCTKCGTKIIHNNQVKLFLSKYIFTKIALGISISVILISTLLFLFCVKTENNYQENKVNDFQDTEQVSYETEKIVNNSKKIENKDEFAQNIRNIMKQHDIISLSELIQYPIEIDNMSINNKTEFINKIDKEKLFSQEMIDNVCNTEIFENYQGIMLGDGPNIWFTNFDEEFKIYAINL